MRYEYQKDVGNLSHIHLILQVLWNLLTEQEKVFVKDLIRASNCEIVRPEEVEDLIREGVFKNYDSWMEMQSYGETFLTHICNERRLMRVKSEGGKDDFNLRILQNILI